jgi:hypothetical protein
MADEDPLSAVKEGLGFDPEAMMAAFAAQLGDQETLASVWSNTLDEQQVVEYRSVQTKKQTEWNFNRFFGKPGKKDNAVEKLLGKGGRKEFTTTREVTSRKPRVAEEMLKEFVGSSRANPAAFAKMQQDLYLAGFFNPSVSVEEIQHGFLDDYTLDAYYNLMRQSAQLNASGQDVTTMELLNERAARNLGPIREAMMRATRGGGGGTAVTLTDPVALAQGLDQTAKEVLGRKASAEEQRLFITMFHGLQRGNAGEGGINPDGGARAEAFLREQAPVEAQSHDVARTFDDFMDIIGGLGVMNNNG